MSRQDAIDQIQLTTRFLQVGGKGWSANMKAIEDMKKMEILEQMICVEDIIDEYKRREE